MAVLETKPHELTVRTGNEPWGCANRKIADGYWVKLRQYDSEGRRYELVDTFIEHTMSKDCRQEGTLNNPRCNTCRERGLGDAYVESVRKSGS